MLDARAAPEVETVSKMYLEIWSKSTKTPPKCVQTRDPKTRGQIPKHMTKEVRGDEMTRNDLVAMRSSIQLGGGWYAVFPLWQLAMAVGY